MVKKWLLLAACIWGVHGIPSSQGGFGGFGQQYPNHWTQSQDVGQGSPSIAADPGARDPDFEALYGWNSYQYDQSQYQGNAIPNRGQTQQQQQQHGGGGAGLQYPGQSAQQGFIDPSSAYSQYSQYYTDLYKQYAQAQQQGSPNLIPNRGNPASGPQGQPAFPNQNFNFGAGLAGFQYPTQTEQVIPTVFTGPASSPASTGPQGNAADVLGGALPEILDLSGKSDEEFLTSESFVLDKEDCITEDGEIGECLSAQKCGYTKGSPNGLCHQGMDVDSKGKASGRVCCVYQSICGFETNHEVTYFKNPVYPMHTNNTDLCHFRVNLLDEVCQLRLDFVEFNLKPLEHGQCDPSNSMSISSKQKRAFIPVSNLCGQLQEDGDELDPIRGDLNHMYIHMDDIPLDSAYAEIPNSINNAPQASVDFKIKINNYPSKWNIRISQIACDGAPLQSPSGCGQYYNTQNGSISSLNIADKSYPLNLKLAACIRTDTSACAIKYNFKDMQFGDVKNRKEGKMQLGYGLTCQDYIALNGLKSGVCGSAVNKEIILPIDGPQGLSIVTDGFNMPEVEQGFKIDYSFIHQCDDTTPYFKFPSAK